MSAQFCLILHPSHLSAIYMVNNENFVCHVRNLQTPLPHSPRTSFMDGPKEAAPIMFYLAYHIDFCLGKSYFSYFNPIVTVHIPNEIFRINKN